MGKRFFVCIQIVFIVFLMHVHLCSQICFERYYGGEINDSGSEVIQTSDGGYLFTVWSTTEFRGIDILLIKTDQYGDTLWTKVIGDAGDDMAEGLMQTDDGGYMVLAGTSSYGHGGIDFQLIKTDADGNVIWRRQYGGENDDFCFSFDQTSDKGYILAGYTAKTNGYWDIYIIKTDSSGIKQWEKVFSPGEHNFARYIIETADGGYVYTGYTYATVSGSCYLYIGRIDTNGDEVWSKTLWGSDIDFGFCIQRASPDGYIVAGYTTSFGAGSRDVYLVRIDEAGNTLWTKTYGGTNREFPFSIVNTTDDGFALVGITESFGSGPADIYLLRTDSNGDTLWTRTFGGPLRDEGYDLIQTTDGGFAIVGNHYFLEGITEKASVALIKTNEAGLVTGIRDLPQIHSIPGFSLHNYPNPFNSSTRIGYTLPGECFVQLSICNIRGQILATLISETQYAGYYEYTWNADEHPAGVYLYQLRANDYTAVKRLLHLK